MSPAIIGATIGVLAGITGGIIGTYFSIKNTGGPKERTFMIKAAVVGWIAAIGFLILLFYLPKPYNFLLWIPYGVALPTAIIYVNRKQRQIQEQEKGIEVKASRMLLSKARLYKLFSPSASGVYLPERLSRRFLDGLAKRIESGLFPKASESRNRYVISSRTEGQLKFHGVGLLTSAYVGLNDVSVKVDSSPGSEHRVLWNVKYWKWAMYGVRLCLLVGILLILTRFFLFPGWFSKWWYCQPECFHGLCGEILFWSFVLFWGLLWPWILVVLHKRPVSRLLRYIFDEINQSQLKIYGE